MTSAGVGQVRASANAVLAIVAVAQFMVVLDASVVNVALPSIQRDVGFSEQSLSWVLNAYTLLFGGFLLLGGRASSGSSLARGLEARRLSARVPQSSDSGVPRSPCMGAR